MPPWVPAAISGAAGLIATIVRNKREKKKAATERQWAKEDWDRVNAYNTPKAQMERFKDANLNPNLMYGQGTPGLAGDIGQTEAAAPDAGIEELAGTAINAYYNFERHKAGMDKVEQDTRLQKANAIRQEAENMATIRHLADTATNSAAKTMYEAELKEMERDTMREQRAGFAKGDLTYEQGNIKMGEGPQNINSLGKFKNVQEIQNLNSQAQAEKWINEQNLSSKEKRARITELNDLIDNMPDGINPIKWTQAMLKYIMSK